VYITFFMTVTVRFAPSPTGFLHIGGARTALFNYLFARHHGGRFLLRVEDTDKARSTQAAIDAIIDGMAWLGLAPDSPPVLQSSREERHREVAQELLARGAAYRCYMSAEELTAAREAAQAKGEIYRYDGRWRDAPASDAPANVTPSIRLKAPITGSITLKDAVQGEVSVACAELDDMVLLRSDGTPTYLLAVVVDDHDMGITHIIRGDDHFTNNFRQALIYQALAWDMPETAHIPLIHGSDGAKLSKRHGALGVEAYREMGYLPEAVRNYLLRLGWSHGDDEIISDTQAIEWFTLEGLVKSPARFDFDKLGHLNAHYIRAADAGRIEALSLPHVEALLERPLNDEERAIFHAALPELQARATTLVDLAEASLFFFSPPTAYTDQAAKMLQEAKDWLPSLTDALRSVSPFDAAHIEAACKAYGEAHGLKLGKVMNPLRAAVTGSHASPSMFHILPLLGKEETIKRLRAAIS
jgi:glutamyl-tRNA synthetase